jgi:hypothetical protein
MRRALGIAVFSGMLGVTFFGIFLTPVFYYVIQWFAERHAVANEAPTGPAPAPPAVSPAPAEHGLTGREPE